jgi:D-3-phosphoglycerate dehydrogenase / 2-oxoglutarate reductase
MRVLIADKFEDAGKAALTGLGCTLDDRPSITPEDLQAVLAGGTSDLLIVRSKKVTAAAILGARGLRAIVRAGAGVDNIDMTAATERGIGVCNCPGMNAIAVAELAVGLLISCDRRIPDQTAAIKAGRWEKKTFTTGASGLKGSSLLIVGFGAIGKVLASRALAFDMDVVAWDRALTSGIAKAHGVRFAGTDRRELLAALPGADAVSIHVALVPQTAHFCNAEFFEAMKPGAIFINTARGGVVDEASLYSSAIAKGLRVGLDVYEHQPSTPIGEFVTPISSIPGCALTHHCGASTAQAQAAVADETVRIVRVFMETGQLENCVNCVASPEVKTPVAQPARGAAR